MKSNLPVIILLLVCLGLGIVVYLQSDSRSVQTTQQVNTISNDLTSVSNSLKAQIDVNTILESNIATVKIDAAKQVAEAEARRHEAQTNLEVMQKEALENKNAFDKAAAIIDEQNREITNLTVQNNELDKQTKLLNKQIADLTEQITATKDLLAKATSDKALLSDEILRLEAKRQDLENRLSDIAALKEQISTIKDNLTIARRITWMQQGVYNNLNAKGGQLLISPPKPSLPATNTSLDVEFHQGGGVKINSPSTTNSPPSPAVPPNR
jgi:chromosome segregation ATPase